MRNHLTTEHIIDGCRKGHAQCQRALVDRYSDQLYAVCLRYMGEPHKAQDVLQDAFIRIFKSFKNFDTNKGALHGWMKKITINMALKTIQKDKLKFAALTTDYNEQFSIKASAVSNMAADELMQVVQTLPDGYRQVFNLSVVEGYSHKEIADMLGIQEVSSRSNLSRAKQLLRKKLSAFKNSESWVRII